MDHAEQDELSRWVRESAELLAPPVEWAPNQKAARIRIEFGAHRKTPAWRLLPIGAATLGIVLLFAVLVPLSRAVAQQSGGGWHALDQLWYWVTLNRHLQLVRLGQLPEGVKSFVTGGAETSYTSRPVSAVSDASAQAGFPVRLPERGTIPGAPQLSILNPATFGTGPIGVRLGARVVAQWGPSMGWSQMTLMQSAPPAFRLPPGSDLVSFASVPLRRAQMSEESARRFAQYAVPPATLFLGDGTVRPAVNAAYVDLRHEPAVLIEEFGDSGHHQWEHGPPIERMVLLWSVSDRVFALTADLDMPLVMTSYELAGKIAALIDAANGVR